MPEMTRIAAMTHSNCGHGDLLTHCSHSLLAEMANTLHTTTSSGGCVHPDG